MIVATFAVTARVDNEFNSVDRATATIERYLYHPLQILGTERFGNDTLRVIVAGAYIHEDLARFRVQYQRERLASGSFGTTGPTFTEV